MENQKLLSTKEAATFLGVDRKTIQRYRKAGILVPDQLGKNNSVLYTKEQLVQVATRLLSSCDKFLKFNPQVATRYQQVVTNYTELDESESDKKCKSIRVIPAKLLVMPNDKLTKELFRHTPEEYLALFEEGGEIVEVKKVVSSKLCK